jgi:hypothetical protein
MSFSTTGAITTIGNQEKTDMSGVRWPQSFGGQLMTTLNRFVIVAALLAGGTSLAIAQTQMPPATGGAAGNPSHATKKYNCVGARNGLVECHTKQMSANTKGTSAGSGTATHGTDTVILSAAQRRAVWKDLSKQANNQNATGFRARVGTFVPKSMKIQPMPINVTANNPKLRPYGFAMVGNKLLIVDPSNKVIADVLTK